MARRQAGWTKFPRRERAGPRTRRTRTTCRCSPLRRAPPIPCHTGRQSAAAGSTSLPDRATLQRSPRTMQFLRHPRLCQGSQMCLAHKARSRTPPQTQPQAGGTIPMKLFLTRSTMPPVIDLSPSETALFHRFDQWTNFQENLRAIHRRSNPKPPNHGTHRIRCRDTGLRRNRRSLQHQSTRRVRELR